MSISAAIAPHLPHLRRYARILSGSQASGDAYVVATLESLIADTTAFDQTIPAKLSLYRQFLAVWGAINNGNKLHVPSETLAGAERSIEAITPRPRQAFLLATVEGFDVPEIAIILDTDHDEVIELLDGAAGEIADQIATDVLIIEDEPIIAMDIEALTEQLGHRVIGVARTHKEAVKLAERSRPGLVLADVQLADGSSGLEAVIEILGGYDVPVIFITAYPERLLTGERPEPTFLITKPFQAETLKAVISQALFFDARARRPDPLATGTGA
jgi:CheY-like chemotaxis protein/DNA-directed RNA polymerase specialized sigma24 family protein